VHPETNSPHVPLLYHNKAEIESNTFAKGGLQSCQQLHVSASILATCTLSCFKANYTIYNVSVINDEIWFIFKTFSNNIKCRCIDIRGNALTL